MDAPESVELEEGLDSSGHFTTGAIRVVDLIEEAPEDPADRIGAVATVGALIGLGQQSGWEEPVKELIEVKEALLAEGVDPQSGG